MDGSLYKETGYPSECPGPECTVAAQGSFSLLNRGNRRFGILGIVLRKLPSCLLGQLPSGTQPVVYHHVHEVRILQMFAQQTRVYLEHPQLGGLV